MKKQLVWTTIALGVGASGAGAQEIKGSDTLRELSIDVASSCIGGGISYVGGGTGNGGNAMAGLPVGTAVTQQVAPQSRFLSAAECKVNTPAGLPDNTGQGLRVALDALAIWKDKTEHQFNCTGDRTDCYNWPSVDDGGENKSSAAGGAAAQAPNATTGKDCRVLRYAGCMTLQDLNSNAVLGFGNGVAGIDDGTGALLGAGGNAAIPLVGGQYCFTHWADALRIIYTGQHQHLNDSSLSAGAACATTPAVVGVAAAATSTRRCNSDVRRTLVETWSNLFDYVGDDGQGGCTDKNCTALKHAWRRDDLSGTTDTFLQLIGAPAANATTRTFCNGIENEDQDPIRRACNRATNASLDPDSVCATMPFKNRNAPFSAVDGSPTGAPGAVAATPPTSTDLADLGLVLPISLPTRPANVTDAVWLGIQYDSSFCAAAAFGGSFKFAPMPTVALPAGQKCPDGNNRVAGQCRYPVNAAGRFNCTARRTNRPGGIVWANFDARAYNLTPRDPVTGVILQPNAGAVGDARWGGGGHYRIHQTLSKPSQITGAVLKGVHPACKLPDATQQIGCLVEADMCSIGFAGLSANDPTTPDLAYSEGSRDLHGRTFTSATPLEVGTNWPLLLRAPYDVATDDVTVAGGAPRNFECAAASSGPGWWADPQPANGDFEIDPIKQLHCAANSIAGGSNLNVDLLAPDNAVNDNDGEPNKPVINRVLDTSNVANCNTAGSFHIRYPLARALWVNASKGYGFAAPVLKAPGISLPAGSPVTGSEAAFVQCMVNAPDNVIERNGFLPVPAGATVSRFCPP